MVLAVCQSVLGNASDAEDAAQAAFLTLARKASTVRGQTVLAGWLHQVAWFVARRAALARAIRRHHEQEAARMKSQIMSEPLPSVPQEALHEALAGMPEKYRLPLLLHYIEGSTQEETAALMNCSISAAAMRLNRGREMLRKRLAKRGGIISLVGLATLLGQQTVAQASPTLVSVTTNAAAGLLGQAATAAAISAKTLALTKGAMNMMFWAKMKVAAAVALAFVLTTGAVGTYVAVAQSRTGLSTEPPRNYATTTAPATRVYGKITAVGNGTVTLHNGEKNKDYLVTINESTVVRVNGKAAKASDLKVGMNAAASGTEGNVASEIVAYMPGTTSQPAPTTAPAGTRVYGKITAVGGSSITLHNGEKNKDYTVTFNETTVIRVNGQAAKAADLKVGMNAGASGTEGNAAREIVAYIPGTTSQPAPTPAPAGTRVGGKITVVAAGSITLHNGDSNKDFTIGIDAATVIRVNGKAAQASDLKVGMNAAASFVEGKPAREISAYMPTAPTSAPAPTGT